MLNLFERFSMAHGALTITAALVAAAPALAPSVAQAATDEMITTTARGRTESVQDVPATVAVISQESINAYGVQRVEDFVNLVPGVTLVDAAEVGDTQINIRGINGARDAENSIALVIDGILMTNPAAVNREYTNLQQIEVMKGPQGAIYGRNAAAGAFIITTQKPGDEFSAKFRGSVAEDDTYQLLGNLSGPIGNSIGWSLGADFNTSDGYYQNKSCTQAPCSDTSNIVTTDGVTDSFEAYNVDGRLVWDVSETWELDGKFRYGEVDANSITFNSVFQLPAFAGFSEEFFEDVNDHPFGFNTNVISTNEQEATEVSLRSTNSFGWADMTVWGLYSDIQNSLGADGTSGAFGFFFQDPNCRSTTADLQGFPLNSPQYLGPVPEFPNSVYGAYTPTTCDGTQYQERNQKDVSFELRLASNSDQALRWSAGLYYLTIDREVGVNTGIDSGNGIVQSLYVPNGGAPGVNNATEGLVHDQFDSDVYAVFGALDWDMTENVTAGLALRYDQEKRKAKSLVPTVADGATAQFITCDPGNAPFTDPINPGLCPDVNPSGEFSPRSKDFDAWQPKISLTWDIYPTLTAFTSYGVGFKSGGFNNQGSAATVDKYINSVPGIASGDFSPVGVEDNYRKETSGSFEIGFKSEINDGRLRWEASYYHVDVDDMQFFEFIVGPFGLLRVVENVDDVKMDGIEISGVWSPTDTVNLFAGANWIDSEIKRNDVRPDTVGNKSPYTPDWTFNTGGDMSFPMTSNLNLIGSIDLTGVGKTWFHVVQNQERPVGAVGGFTNGDYGKTQRDVYWLANLRLGVAGDKWSVVAFGRNIGDEAWLQEVLPAPEFGGTFTHPGTLARWGIEATFNF